MPVTISLLRILPKLSSGETDVIKQVTAFLNISDFHQSSHQNWYVAVAEANQIKA